MIPISLTLSNFMPYGTNVPTINFAGIHVAAVCGDNGSGKSSLIDAMTWALWGKTRARSDDDLVHQGEMSMQVQFDFAAGGQVYRVIRKHTRPRSRRASGQSSLDLFVSNGGSFRPISADRIGDTEKKVAEILHMDYDTFINSAFLRQGHADEFTVAKPAERKNVLTNILGLSTYDRLEMRARQMAGQRESEKTQAETALRDIDRELANKPAYESELIEAEEQLRGIDRTMADCEGRLAKLRQAKELLNGKQQQLAQLEEQISHASRDLGRWSEQAKQGRLRVEEYERLLADRTAIEAGYASLVALRRQNDELNQNLRLVKALGDRQHQLDMTIERASRSLLAEHTLATNRVSELQSKHAKSALLKNDLRQAQAEIAGALRTEESLAVARQGLQQLQLEVRHLEADRARTASELVEIDEKMRLLASGAETKCPLCEQDLGAEHLALIRQKYTQDKSERQAAGRSLVEQLTRKREEVARLEREVAASETQVTKVKDALQLRASVATRELSDAEEAGRQMEAEKEKLVLIEERLARKDYAALEQEELVRAGDKLAALAYDAQRHEQVRQQVAELERYEAPKHRLDEAGRLVDQARETAAGAETAARELGASLQVFGQRKEELSVALTSLPGVTASLSQAEAEYQQLLGRQKQAGESLGSVREKINRCTQLETARVEKEMLFKRAAGEEGIYRELAEAFGKRGVQALLIEIALPEIEAEANRLLGRMTDNRMHVKFETQRETKKGDILETLDINIADELGTRSYEMFSGGEAFRINFAIRIALSKVLARRAGAPLPTLIIDEGFGTQDANGMERLKEAITSVQGDFEKILVITHIEDFRDAFPVRIEVVKTAEGSTVEVV
jgi:exonuclease SbcC